MNKSSHKHISKAHDHFFRMVMSDKRVSREFFEAHLPDDLRCVVDLNYLEIQSGTYIDDMRQEAIADMLFKTIVEGHEAYLYLVVDHQSQPDELMPFRCLKYTCNFIDQHLKNIHKKNLRLPLVVPMVFYHGQRPWVYSTNINDLVDAPKNLIDTYFLRPFKLIDLSLIKDETLKKRTWLGVVELTMKHIFARDMLPYLHDIIGLLKQLTPANTNNFSEIVLTYILDRGELSDKNTFIDMIKAGLSPEEGGKIVTIAEQFRAEGLQQGIQQGREQGREQGRKEGKEEGMQEALVALDMLSQGVNVSVVATEMGLSIKEVESLKNYLKTNLKSRFTLLQQ